YGTKNLVSSFGFHPLDRCVKQFVGYFLIIDTIEKTELPFRNIVILIIYIVPDSGDTSYNLLVLVCQKKLSRRILIKRVFVWIQQIILRHEKLRHIIWIPHIQIMRKINEFRTLFFCCYRYD